MIRLVALMLALVVGSCSPPDPPNVRAGKQTSKPIRWRADADCIRDVDVPLGLTRDSLALECSKSRAGKSDFIALALSGGGVKAAVFSAESMFYLQALGLLHRTDVVSSVSGGSFTAGVYALSCDPGDDRNEVCKRRLAEDDKGLVWRHDDVLKTVGQGYTRLVYEQIARLVVPGVPGTISSDRFASYIDDRFFGHTFDGGRQLLFKDVNPRRPLLAVNSTIVSANRAGLGGSGDRLSCYGDSPNVTRGWLRRRTPDEFYHFAYTDVYFDLIRSDLDQLPVSQAVAASGAFPVLIDQPKLTDFCRKDKDDSIITLTDGGTNDNQGIVEIYHILAELAFGERRSDVPEDELQKVRMRPGDAAFIFVINSSVTDTTGPSGSGSGEFPLGAFGLVNGIISKVSEATDVLGSTNFNLRRNLYFDYARATDIQKISVNSIDIGLDKLDQYPTGGSIYNLWKKAGILDTPDTGGKTDVRAIDQVIRARVDLQADVARKLIHSADSRRRMALSDYHPQCYFDIRGQIDSSLVSIPDDTQACLREAARWSVALSADEMCLGLRAGERAPAGLRCKDGLPALDSRVLGGVARDREVCKAVIDKFIAAHPVKDPSGNREGCHNLNDE
ncbi:patatin-like phospholipase family protein [Rhodopila sp.]|uniref:patatin-like phospholipase family protein n=1 Tax=Rhodopila sp. TaxID=2480087 RepID=UPI003D10602A